MSCQECKARCYPEDPSQPFYTGNGRYLPPLCQCCNAQLEDRVEELNNLKEEVERLKKIGVPYFVVQLPVKPKTKRSKELKAIEG